MVALRDQRVIVRCEQDGRAGSVNLFEQGQNVDRQVRIEVSRRLVGKDQRRLGNDRARDGDSLLLPSRKAARSLFAATRETYALERLGHPRPYQALGHGEDLESDRHVFKDRPVVDDAKVLEHDPEVAPQEGNRLLGESADVSTAEEHPTLVNGQLSIDKLQERALAGSARTGNENELAALHAEVHTSKRGLVGTEVLVDVFQHQDRLGERGLTRPRAEERKWANDLAFLHRVPLTRRPASGQENGRFRGLPERRGQVDSRGNERTCGPVPLGGSGGIRHPEPARPEEQYDAGAPRCVRQCDRRKSGRS